MTFDIFQTSDVFGHVKRDYLITKNAKHLYLYFIFVSVSQLSFLKEIGVNRNTLHDRILH